MSTNTHSTQADELLDRLLMAGHYRRPVLLLAAPGAGASMLARRLSRAVPNLAGLAAGRAAAAAVGLTPAPERAPFRAPHHTCSEAGLVGRRREAWEYVPADAGMIRASVLGPRYSPGEVHLAQGGVLLLDELLEFRLASVDAVSREARRLAETAPWIIAVAPRCGCGAASHRTCACDVGQVERHRARLGRVASPLHVLAGDVHTLDAPLAPVLAMLDRAGFGGES